MTDDEKPLPPVPPAHAFVHPEKRHGTRILERERVDTCDCGGTIYEERVVTGRIIVETWDAEQFDADEFRVSNEREETEGRVECDCCGAGWTF